MDAKDRPPAPALEQSVPCIEGFGWSDRPAVSGETVFLAGGASDSHGPIAFLQGIDRATGASRFVLEKVALAGHDVVCSEVHATAGGGAFLAVYTQDESLDVVVVDGAGRVLVHHELGAEGSLVGHDIGSKVALASQPEVNGRYLVSYAYRDNREYRTFARALGATSNAWDSPEWLLAATNHVVVGAASQVRRPRDRPVRLLARARHDGAVVWRRDFPEGQLAVAGASESRLLVVDRSPQLRGAGSLLWLLDLATGEEVARIAVAGDVLDAALNEHGATVLRSGDAKAGAALLRFDGGGQQRAAVEVAVPELAYNGGVRLVHAGADAVLWVDARATLQLDRLGAAAADPGGPLWSWPLPYATAGFRRRVTDRLLPWSTETIDGNRLFLRSGGRLWTASVTLA
ncbi:MAG: hypothetical protein JWP97_2807 [Labilithrix sp.]|nr:hypothetical protein [Labilithrix sp.]